MGGLVHDIIEFKNRQNLKYQLDERQKGKLKTIFYKTVVYFFLI